MNLPCKYFDMIHLHNQVHTDDLKDRVVVCGAHVRHREQMVYLFDLQTI